MRDPVQRVGRNEAGRADGGGEEESDCPELCAWARRAGRDDPLFLRCTRFRLLATKEEDEAGDEPALHRFSLFAEDEADGDERGRRDQPGDEPLRDRADVAEAPAARVVRRLRVLDVGDDRVELAVRERLLREAGHHVRPDADGLGDLRRRRVLQRRRFRSRQIPALGDHLVATGAVLA